MVGLIRYNRERGRSRPQIESFCGVTALTADLYDPEGRGGKKVVGQLRKLERVYRKTGVSRVILPEHFPYRDGFTLVRPVDPRPFYRAMADLLLLGVLERKGIRPGRARATLAGPRLCPELRVAAERLCPIVRELKIDVPGEEGEDFARYLQHEYGIPVIPHGMAADAVISFGGTGGEADLDLWDGSGIRFGMEGIALPQEIGQSVLTLLWERGRVKRELLRVINLP